MQIQFNLDDKYHLVEKSYYNHNYYLLPYTIEQCTILYEECQDDSYTVEYSIGNFNDKGKFVEEYCWYGDADGNVDLVNNRIE